MSDIDREIETIKFREWKKERKRILIRKGIDVSCITDKGCRGWKSRYNSGKKISKKNKGRKFSIEHRKNIGKSIKGRKVTWGDKVSKTLTGRKRPKEFCEKRREYMLKHGRDKNYKEAKKKLWSNPDFLKKMHQKRFIDSETRKRMSDGHIGLKHSPKTIRKMIETKRKNGFKHTEKTKRTLSKKKFEYYKNHPEEKIRMGNLLRSYQGTPKYCENIRKAMIRRMERGDFDLKPNYSEQFLMDILNQMYPNQWRYTGDGKLWIGNQNPDFIHKKENKIIELFGDYWHTIKARQTPTQRKNKYKKSGYDCLIVWHGKDKLWRHPENVIQKIEDWHGRN